MRVAEDYIRLFWLHYVNEFFREQGFLKKAHDFSEPVRGIYTAWWHFFVDRAIGDFIASEIASLLCAPNQPLPSIRTLRATVTRCFSLLFHAFLYHKESRAPLETWRCEEDKEPSARMLELIGKIRGRHGPDRFSSSDVGAVSEMRGIVRASASVQV
jgi:hypothetical protein